MEALKNNVKDTALVIEGGGTRASYSAAFINQLLAQGIYFNYVTGISAGSSHLVNYLSRDSYRTRVSFTDLMADKKTHGLLYFLRGKGFFNSHYLYEELAQPDGGLPYDFETFQANPAECRIGSFNLNTGPCYFSKSDMTSLDRLFTMVRASSSLPVFMPTVHLDGNLYCDGGIAGGIPLDIAIEDGYERFFIVMTKPSSYWLKEKSSFHLHYLKHRYRNYPAVYEALADRPKVYNETLKKARRLEKEGKALIVYSEEVQGSNKETDVDVLRANYDRGWAQSLKELPRWKEFLGL